MKYVIRRHLNESEETQPVTTKIGNCKITKFQTEMWNVPCTFYSPDGKNNKWGVAIIDMTHGGKVEKHIHFVDDDNEKKERGLRLTKDELEAIYKVLSKDFKKGDILMTRGGASPGGIHGMLELARIGGFDIKSVLKDKDSAYWYGRTDENKLKKWMSDPKNKKWFYTEDGKTYPILPILTKR